MELRRWREKESRERLSKHSGNSRQAGRRKNSSVFQRQPSKQLKRVQELQHSTVTSFVSIKIDTRARGKRGARLNSAKPKVYRSARICAFALHVPYKKVGQQQLEPHTG
jgi:hypothetical protein